MCDVGARAGLGHRKRMLALAAALTDLGLEAAVGGHDLQPGRVTVIDSYSVHAARPIRGASVVCAVDDLGRDLDVDVLVDPNPPPFPQRSRADLVLAGVEYALLDLNLLGVGSAKLTEDVRTVLVTTGAADASGFGATVADAIHRELPELNIRLIIGPWAEQKSIDGVELVIAPDSLAHDLAAADLVVTAGGVTMLESLRLGRPTVVIELADNQHRAIAGAAAHSAIRPSSVERVATDVSTLAEDVVERRRLATAAALYVDGRGARRVAEALVARL